MEGYVSHGHRGTTLTISKDSWIQAAFVWARALVIGPFLLTLLLYHSVRNQIRYRKHAGNPPFARPGHRAEDYCQRLFVHPFQRRRIRKMRVHRDGMKDSRFPIELCALVVDMLHDDRQALGSASQVCMVWMGLAYRHLFQNIRLTRHRAYSFIQLAQSPYRSPSLLTSIRKVNLYGDVPPWNVVEPTLLELVKLGLSLETLDIRLFHRPVRLSEDHLSKLRIQNLTLMVDAPDIPESPAMRALLEIPTLKSLSLNLRNTYWLAFSSAPLPDPPLRLSPLLESLTLIYSRTFAFQHSEASLTGLILRQHLPKLHSLQILTRIPDIQELRECFVPLGSQITYFGFSMYPSEHGVEMWFNEGGMSQSLPTNQVQ